MTSSDRMEDGWSSWLAGMIYILRWLVSARLPVSSVHKGGWEMWLQDPEVQGGKGMEWGQIYKQGECSLNQNHTFAWDSNILPKLACVNFRCPVCPRPFIDTSSPTSVTSISPSTQAQGDPASYFHSNSSGNEWFFSQPTGLGFQALPV